MATLKPTLTPKLRFPEFRDAPGWSTSLGDELFDQINNREAPAGLPILAITQEHGAIPRDAIDYHVSVTDKSVETYKEVLPGDFIISLRSFQGGIEYSEYHGICSQAYIILRKKTELTDLFFRYQFKSHRFIQQLTKNLEGLRDGKMISYKQFSELLVPAPSPPEQQKIADCLSSLDELIGAESRKLDALKAHKKGLMQQLFPREGEPVPRLRFPEFQGMQQWASQQLEDVYFFLGNNSLSRDKLNYEQGSFKNIHYGDIHTKFSTLFDISKESVPYINPSEPLDSIREENFCAEGDIIFADASEDLEDVGKNIEIIRLNGEPVVAGLHTILARQTGDHFDIGFGGYLFKSNRIRLQIQKESQGAKVFGISAKRLRKIGLLFPSDKAEQQRIASCLSSLDDMITAQSDMIEALKTHKKGLMQQLFPSQEDR